MADFHERMLEPANLLVVNNLQSLVIRQLERDMALAQVSGGCWAGMAAGGEVGLRFFTG
jgi:hypothetical protein